MTTSFITGANKSLGLETARRLGELGHHVVVGARDPERGRPPPLDRIEAQFAAPLYASSKAAVTMLTTQYAKALPELRINAVRPRVHRHGLQRSPRDPDPRRGHGRDRRAGHHRSGRPTGTLQDRYAGLVSIGAGP